MSKDSPSLHVYKIIIFYLYIQLEIWNNEKKLFNIVLISLFAIHIPAKAQTTTSERIYILSSVWKDVCKNFAFPERFKEVNPDSLYKEYIPKVLHAESEQHFSNLMAEFLSSFNDGHTKFNDNNMKRYKVPVIFFWGQRSIICN